MVNFGKMNYYCFLSCKMQLYEYWNIKTTPAQMMVHKIHWSCPSFDMCEIRFADAVLLGVSRQVHSSMEQSLAAEVLDYLDRTWSMSWFCLNKIRSSSPPWWHILTTCVISIKRNYLIREYIFKFFLSNSVPKDLTDLGLASHMDVCYVDHHYTYNWSPAFEFVEDQYEVSENDANL